ncbi:acetate and butyrate kinase [Amylocystis lapponica]|nr:acetate and butyrate kinase [Amylocystis lapponica]
MSEYAAPRDGLILAVNAGSSSLKISLYRRDGHNSRSARQQQPSTDDALELLLTSNTANISAPPATFSFELAAHTAGRELKKEPVKSVKDHTSAFAHFLDYLKREASIDREQIVHVCHRVVHGGDYFEPVVINEESFHHIEKLSDLAPLHNGAALSVMKACIAALPHANSIAYFDTSFHRPIPLHIASYAIRQDIAKKRGLRKYGFHGLSYAYILRAVAQHLHKDPSTTNLIVLHLGSGASACAIRAGQSLDTSMGLTPLNGLPGATRSGAVDPSLVFHYTNRAGRISHSRAAAVDVHVTEAEDILNRRAGWAALTGTADFAEIVRRMRAAEAGEGGDGGWEGEARWGLAFRLFADRVAGYVGSYFVKLGGDVDALVFAGGIGEKSAELRCAVAAQAACLGFALDAAANAAAGTSRAVVTDIGERGAGRRILICRTDEQLEMAKECALSDKLWQ